MLLPAVVSVPRSFLVILALLGAAGTAVSIGCGHTVCKTDADCPSNAVCDREACIRRSDPPEVRPEECGARCRVEERRCRYEPLTSFSERCDVGADGCSVWVQLEECGDGSYCGRDVGCVAYLDEGASCEVSSDTCGPGLTCASLAEVGGSAATTCRRACGVEGCMATETCVHSVCVPSSSCEPCDLGAYRCAGAQASELCDYVDHICGRWVRAATCTGSNVCELGECVGTVPVGGACSEVSACVRGLVCMEDSSTCATICSSSAQCSGGQACRITRPSRGRNTCAGGAGPTIETTCTIGLGRVEVSGSWDEGSIFDPSASPPDPLVSIDGGDFSYATGEYTDTYSVALDQTTGALTFDQLHAVTVRVFDSDQPFSGPDEIAGWRLIDHFAWDGPGRSFDLTLTAPSATLTVALRCTDR